MKFIFSLIILILAAFGAYSFINNNFDFSNGIEIKQEFKDNVQTWWDKTINFMKEKF